MRRIPRRLAARLTSPDNATSPRTTAVRLRPPTANDVPERRHDLSKEGATIPLPIDYQPSPSALVGVDVTLVQRLRSGSRAATINPAVAIQDRPSGVSATLHRHP